MAYVLCLRELFQQQTYFNGNGKVFGNLEWFSIHLWKIQFPAIDRLLNLILRNCVENVHAEGRHNETQHLTVEINTAVRNKISPLSVQG